MKGSKKILSGLRPDYLTDPWSGILIPAPPCPRRTMSANAFFYPLDEPLGPFSPLQNGKESTDIFNLHPNIFIINETSF